MEWTCVNRAWMRHGRPTKTFPLQVDPYDKELPLAIAQEAYKEYSALYGTSQSLETLGERGGFGASEIAILLYQRIKRLEAGLPAQVGE